MLKIGVVRSFIMIRIFIFSILGNLFLGELFVVFGVEGKKTYVYVNINLKAFVGY